MIKIESAVIQQWRLHSEVDDRLLMMTINYLRCFGFFHIFEREWCESDSVHRP